MDDKQVFDPFKLWKETYDQWSQQWGEQLDDSLRQEAFSQWMGQWMNLYLQTQKWAQASSESYVEQLNIPTKKEIANVAALIIGLEEKVDGLEEQLQELKELIQGGVGYGHSER